MNYLLGNGIESASHDFKLHYNMEFTVTIPDPHSTTSGILIM